ncbi:MAG: outer membrane protein assembly factor BamA, partial [Candidatus Marinamargulisbacteria bacterium]
MIKRLSVILIWAILAIPTSGQDAGQLNLKKILDTLSAPAVISANATKRLKKKEPVKDPITEIAVTGNLNIPTRFILNEMSTHTGDPLNPYKINRDVRNIQSLGLFASVRSDIEKSLGQIKLTIHVKENPTLKSIEFHGATLYTPEKLKSVLKSKQGEIFNLSYVRKDIQAVEKLYKDEGYFQAKVFNVKTPEKPG